MSRAGPCGTTPSSRSDSSLHINNEKHSHWKYSAGKVLGGTSMVNEMLYTRGGLREFEHYGETKFGKEWLWS